MKLALASIVGIILEKAHKFAIQKCIVAGGNASGYACSIRYCR